MVLELDGAKRLQKESGGAVEGLFFKLQEGRKDELGTGTFGKKIIRNAASSSESNKWNYLYHNDGNNQQETVSQGASGTRFHKGFARRSGSAIGQDKERIEREAVKDQKRQMVSQLRRKELNSQDKRNGFDVIKSSNKLPDKEGRPRRKVIGETKSKTLNREAEIILRDSSSRYFGNCEPPPQRVGVIRTEGLLQPRYTSLLGIGRSEVQSYGVADSFQYSMYGQRGTEVGRDGIKAVNSVSASQQKALSTRPW
jgi:hypothetical protein